ncbi:MAG: DUF4381 domain-containing protein [Pseudomonadota bacterium]
MNPEAIVGLLEPLRSPDAVPFWPPAPGWWVLGALWLALLTYALFRLWQRHQRGAALREARAEIERIAASSMTTERCCSEVAALQRRVALHLGERRVMASMVGRDWADALNKLASDDSSYFSEEVVALHYAPTVSDEARELAVASTRRWLHALRPAL